MHTKIWWSYVHIRYLVHVQKWTYLALGWPYGWALNFKIHFYSQHTYKWESFLSWWWVAALLKLCANKEEQICSYKISPDITMLCAWLDSHAVSRCEVSVDKVEAGEVRHSLGHLLAQPQQLPRCEALWTDNGAHDIGQPGNLSFTTTVVLHCPPSNSFTPTITNKSSKQWNGYSFYNLIALNCCCCDTPLL